eukprot:GHVU01010429.1.p1 GENE.GHVU01010429.1~~GHVU01010429.1.p1  ORF type:complete len:161 (+),score=11.18 GHVU01010429.1:330-812(+)
MEMMWSCCPFLECGHGHIVAAAETDRAGRQAALSRASERTSVSASESGNKRTRGHPPTLTYSPIYIHNRTRADPRTGAPRVLTGRCPCRSVVEVERDDVAVVKRAAAVGALPTPTARELRHHANAEREIEIERERYKKHQNERAKLSRFVFLHLPHSTNE